MSATALSAADLLAEAAAALERGRHAEAETMCRKLLAARPDHGRTLHLLGLALSGQGRHADALASFERAVAVKPDYHQAYSNRGNTLRDLGRNEEALASYDRALTIKPDYASARYNRANLLQALGRQGDALADFDAAIALRPDFAAAHSNRSLALQALGRMAEALASCDRAIALAPDLAAAHVNRGTALHRLRRFGDALAAFDRALQIEPSLADALHARALTLHELKRYDEALASCERALAAGARNTDSFYLRGTLLHVMNHGADARASYAAALSVQPDRAELALAACMAELPILYAGATEIDERRSAYERRLRALTARFGGANAAALAPAIGAHQPFFLAYQGRNDRELQALYGALVCGAAAAARGPAAVTTLAGHGEKIRVGLVSGFFHQHSNWKVPIKGWLERLDRDRFRLFGYHTSEKQDAATRAAQALCERFVQGPLPIERWRAEIAADRPHVLIYPEVGMDRASAALAAERLAPVQCNAWGHPDTSGFPTLDHYLSSDLMEPTDGQAHYTERLVRLPNLSIHYEPIDWKPTGVKRTDLGLREGATVFWCGQSTFKFLPQYDDVFARIARGAPDCQFAFIDNPGARQVTELFQTRLERAFADAGLSAADYCVFLRRLDAHGFVAAMGLCDVFLDSIGWSGCNTALESLAHDLPIVTLAGTTMRARHCAAILTMMGFGETIAADIDGYVNVATRMAREPAWRARIASKMAANKHRVYRDDAAIKGLEAFLESVARAS